MFNERHLFLYRRICKSVLKTFNECVEDFHIFIDKYNVDDIYYVEKSSLFVNALEFILWNSVVKGAMERKFSKIDIHY